MLLALAWPQQPCADTDSRGWGEGHLQIQLKCRMPECIVLCFELEDGKVLFSNPGLILSTRLALTAAILLPQPSNWIVGVGHRIQPFF